VTPEFEEPPRGTIIAASRWARMTERRLTCAFISLQRWLSAMSSWARRLHQRFPISTGIPTAAGPDVEYNDGVCHYKYAHNAWDQETHVNRWGDCSGVAIGPNGEAAPVVTEPVLVPRY
jgi:hypothetical protein